ncbi:nucleoside triphosphatase YtkD [Staphylococcus haemolyticus]|uniref:RNA deprotection pyrophosphohydrolase n=1 Tax=Staphylococcus haemolyticus TaxID=1283 RepID=UPI0028580C54|nr:nucleoside triphosphatase YtkD [Staphylococcus haemolyticus]MDR5621760.1 nucleoside triphosphatase YtkD [Staphylococcus haemolyticus]MDT4192015.1 nucleoside triphosphatase YtkD [Staphylococcus haemolyticus]MDT4197189.1 nucleoside triphosphatase YtkD [Staphylococcus haemolyticus]MDT4199651.1 nucleoside triphosphatase YtkD [Staphylococcus haemolyticus]MDT4207520.1 nucleoside triphosphatase YtkD [Staphylococcus haemolyticus]
MEFLDKDNRRVTMCYKTNNDHPDGNHVLAIPLYQSQLLFTHHKLRGIEFPGGKVEKGEESIQAIKRELFEETGGIPETIDYIAQYQVHTFDNSIFKKDVYIVKVKSFEEKSDYLETRGPLLFDNINSIPLDKQSYLIQDNAILKCVERMIELGYYRD